MKKIIILTILILILLVGCGGPTDPENFECPAEKKVYDCMPGGYRSEYCQRNYRNWIMENCEGVGFID